MDTSLYHYKAQVVSVYDGDTLRVDIDLGMGIWKKNESIRMHGINTPEIRSSDEQVKTAAYAARDRLREIVLGKEVVLETFKDKTGKYGRYIGKIWIPNEDGTMICVNDLLLQEGHAVGYPE